MDKYVNYSYVQKRKQKQNLPKHKTKNTATKLNSFGFT